MKKVLVTLDINYPKEITDLTFPSMEQYAKNIGAEFVILKERKYPNLPITQEKFQLYNVSERCDWTIFLDADCLINPNTVDLTNIVNNDIVIVSEYLNPNNQFYSKNILEKYTLDTHFNAYCLVFSKKTRRCVKPWKNPLFFEKYIKHEKSHKKYEMINKKVVEKKWFLDEFLISLNIIKYGISTVSIKQDLFELNIIAHSTGTKEQKIIMLKENLEKLKNMNNINGVYA
jgi:hypothetical protein